VSYKYFFCHTLRRKDCFSVGGRFETEQSLEMVMQAYKLTTISTDFLDAESISGPEDD